MTTVFIVKHFPLVTQTFLVSKFLGFLNRGWDVHMLCLGHHQQLPDHFPELLAPEVADRIHAADHEMARAEALLQTLKPELLHFEFGSLARPLTHWKNQFGSRLTVSFRGYDLNFEGLDQPEYYQPVWQQADGLHLLGDDLWQRAQRRGCPESIPHVLIPPAIDVTFFDPDDRQHTAVAGTAERPFHLLSIGRLVWKKGHPYALQTVAALNRAGVHTHLHIIGDGMLADDLTALAHQLGVAEKVTFWGSQPRDVVREQLFQADALIHTAVSEGFCNAVLEAQAMQLPVVCSDADGLGENVVDGVSGFVLPRRETAVFVETLQTLARDPAERQRLGVAGRQRVRNHFRVENLIDRFEIFYREVIHS